MSTPPRKRPRQEQPPPPPPPPPAEARLPAEMWAHILHFCYFEEVLACTAASKFLLHEVPPQMKFLLVRTGESMDVMPAAVQRFSRVKGVFVYSYIREIPNLEYDESDDDCREDAYRLDEATMRNVVPFLSALPANELFCMLGGLYRHRDLMEWTPNQHIRKDWIEDTLFDPRDTWIRKQLVETACEAYAEGKLSDKVKIRGLLPWDPVSCWLREGSKCAYCERICNSLPPDQVINLHSNETPCVPLADRLSIAQRRGMDGHCSKLTKSLRVDLAYMIRKRVVLCPPDHSTVVHAAAYTEERYEEMEVLISRGADVKDQSMRNAVVVKPDGDDDDDLSFVNGKRIVLLETYTRLKEMGVDVNEQDFAIVDSSDERTNYGFFVYRKMQTSCPESIQEAKDRLGSEKGVSIGVVEAQLKRILDQLDYTFPEFHWRWVHDRLERKLGMDLSGHSDATQALFYAEYCKRYEWKLREEGLVR